MRKHRKPERSSSPAAISAMHPGCRSCSTRSRPLRRSAAPRQTAPTTPARVTMPSLTAGPCRDTAPQDRRTPTRRPLRVMRPFGQRNALGGHFGETRADTTAEVAPGRDEDALLETAGPTADGAATRRSGRRTSASRGRSARLHRTRHSRPRGRGIRVSGNRGAMPATRSVRQGRRHLSIDRTGETTFFLNDCGRPFTPAGFGQRFRTWCDAAGLGNCSAHGLRKAIAARPAKRGRSGFEIMAITGPQTSKEVTRYTKGASQKSRAASAFRKVTGPTSAEKSVPLFIGRPTGGTISRPKAMMSKDNFEKWQPVGESNPSFQVENLAS